VILSKEIDYPSIKISVWLSRDVVPGGHAQDTDFKGTIQTIQMKNGVWIL